MKGIDEDVFFRITIFCISKVPELIDTLFIVLRKQKLIFLHWFHHATVLIYAWYSYHDWTASGRWFVFMNYSVHGKFLILFFLILTLSFSSSINVHLLRISCNEISHSEMDASNGDYISIISNGCWLFCQLQSLYLQRQWCILSSGIFEYLLVVCDVCRVFSLISSFLLRFVSIEETSSQITG